MSFGSLNSWGWDGSVDEAKWGTLSRMVGTDRTFLGDTNFKARPGVLPRTVILSPGLAMSAGVVAESTAEITVQLADVVGANNSRWDVIVIHRDWEGVGGIASIEVLQGTPGSNAAKIIPAAIDEAPGDVEDQLVCFAQITSGSSSAVVEDLRTTSSPVISAPTLTAIRRPRVGMEAVLPDGRRWRYEIVANVAQWRGDRSVQSPTPVQQLLSSQVFAPNAPSWVGTSLVQQLIPITSNAYFLNLALTYRGSSPIVADDATGNFTDTVLGTLFAPYRPNRSFTAACGLTCRKGSPTAGEVSAAGTVAISSASGQVVLKSGMPFLDVYQRAVGSVSFELGVLIVQNSAFNPNS